MARVLFVAANEWEPWGGSEELWSRTALLLRRRGHDVHVSVRWFGHEMPRIAELRAVGCRLHYRRSPFNRTALHLASQRAFEFAGLGYLRACDLVVVSQGMNMDGLPWLQACARRALRYVAIAQAAAEANWIHDREAPALAECYERAAASFFVSNGNLELTRKQLATGLANAEVVRNPFNISYADPIPWPEVDARQSLRLACVARLDPASKGQDLIFDVMRLDHWRRRKVSVSLIGTGRSEQGLRRLADLWDLASVRFCGFQSDIAAVWRDHHALLLPSRIEGLPLAGVEAMLAGRPVIATDVAGNAEIVTDGETGFLATATTAKELDAAMTRAWNARARLQTMGEQAAARIRQLVPPDPATSFADRLETIINRAD